jgi:hypothetical protein
MILATPVVLWAGWPFFVLAARTRNLNMFTLIAMNTGAPLARGTERAALIGLVILRLVDVDIQAKRAETFLPPGMRRAERLH